MPHYPPATPAPTPATIYGSLPDHGFDTVAVVYHTTETRGIPGFNNGDTAPHYLYDAAARSWLCYAELEDGYVGTMKGHSSGHSNCRAFQIEIVAYSDQNLAGSGGLWVGDFTDAHYHDLADFYQWAMGRYPSLIGDAVTETPEGGWRYGTSSPHRMTQAEWFTFSGLTAHGAVPEGNTHWDTGVLDLGRIHTEATVPDPDACPWRDDPCQAHYYPPSSLPRGHANGHNQGDCDVPVDQQRAIEWHFETGRYTLGNGYRYRYTELLSEGREAVFTWRDAGQP